MELMVVLVIIAVLTSVILVSFNMARERTRDEVIKSELEQLMGIAETAYHPELQYEELYKMREDDHENIVTIRNRIEDDMGQDFNFNFPEDSVDFDGFDQYCAYVRLVFEDEKMFCIDYRGVATAKEVPRGATELNCQERDSKYADCDRIEE